MLVKVPTYKSGYFVFSHTYKENEIIEPLTRAITLYATISELPILPNIASRLQEDFIKKSIFGTAAIEGNPLTEEEVGELLSKEPPRIKSRVEQEIQNLKESYKFVAELKEASISEELIKTLHRHVTDKLDYDDSIPGIYRNHSVKVGDKNHGGVYAPPKVLDDIKTLMSAFIEWINSPDVEKLSPFIRASLAHYYLGAIHPFGNGNGRTARLLESLLLRSAGFKYIPESLSNFYYSNLDEYYQVFRLVQKNKEHDMTPFITFALTGVGSSLSVVQKIVFKYIRIFTLKDFYAHLYAVRQLTSRQYKLLMYLIDNPDEISFTLKTLLHPSEPINFLYEKTSEMTARRDLKKLVSENLLREEKKGEYSLNLNLLDAGT